LFALPAIEALAAAHPAAHVTLLGTELHAELLRGRPGPVDDVEVLPVSEGVHEVRGLDEDPARTEQFFERVRARSLDLAVQVHGGGRYSNPFLQRTGARHTIGLRSPDAVALDRTVPYRYYQHEMLRALEVVGLVGAVPSVLEPVLRPTTAELARGEGLRAQVTGGDDVPLLVIHPGATDPRRRWPAADFAEVAARAVRGGARVAVVGDGTDVAAADEIARRAGDGVVSLAGALTLSDLVALLCAADAFAGNDSGPRHLAQALGCATVGVYWIGNVINAGPLARARHRVHMSWTTRCPRCGRSQVAGTDGRCGHDVSFVAEVTVDEVSSEVADLLVDRARPATLSSTSSQRSRNASRP
jgi:ADP-heptose:LPS heptosyltransferase